MRREYPNPLVTGMRFNFSSLLGMGRVTGKYTRVGDGDGEGKTRPHPAHYHAYMLQLYRLLHRIILGLLRLWGLLHRSGLRMLQLYQLLHRSSLSLLQLYRLLHRHGRMHLLNARLH